MFNYLHPAIRIQRGVVLWKIAVLVYSVFFLLFSVSVAPLFCLTTIGKQNNMPKAQFVFLGAGWGRGYQDPSSCLQGLDS